MKKRICALLCALLLAVQLMPASAADTVFFTAVNDNVLALSDSTMPFWSNGYLYISASAFSGRALGVTANLNTEKKTLVLYSRNALTFNYETGATTSNQEESFPESAIMRNGQVFVPVKRVADFFDLAYSHTTISPYGYLLRIRSESSMPDSLFLDSAGSQLTAIYNKYIQGSSGSASGGGAADAAVPPPSPDETVPEGSQALYLCLPVEDIDATAALLDTLDSQGSSRVTFYFPAALLESAGDLSRRMVATGHSIGLWVDGSAGAEAALDQLERGNRLLLRNTGGKTRLCVLSDAQEAVLSRVQAAGWHVLSPKVDASARPLGSSANVSALRKRISAYSGSVSVWLGGGASQNGLRAFVISARANRDKLLPLTELVQ